VSHNGVRNNSRESAISSRNVLGAWSNHCTCTRSSSALICMMRPNLYSTVIHGTLHTIAKSENVPEIIRKSCIQRRRLRYPWKRHGSVAPFCFVLSDRHKYDVPDLDNEPSDGSGPSPNRRARTTHKQRTSNTTLGSEPRTSHNAMRCMKGRRGWIRQFTGASMFCVPSAQRAIARARTKAFLSLGLTFEPMSLRKRAAGKCRPRTTSCSRNRPAARAAMRGVTCV
jgi:hypothetical protein